MSVFLDTSVLVAGLIELGPQSAPAHRLLHAVAEKTVAPASTAWHCCLEFYSVATRLPAEYRLSTADAQMLQRLLERCVDYYDLVEGAPAGPGTAMAELTEGPAGRVPHDLFCLGILAGPNELAGVIGALRNHRREGQWI